MNGNFMDNDFQFILRFLFFPCGPSPARELFSFGPFGQDSLVCARLDAGRAFIRCLSVRLPSAAAPHSLAHRLTMN